MRLPIKALSDLARKYGYSHVVVYAYDAKNNMQHIATYGRTIHECDQAAQFGNMMKDALRWPESLHAEPNRVKKLQDRIKELEKRPSDQGLIRAVNSLANMLIEASSHGYVSSNNLDYANDCLDKVIPFLLPVEDKK